MKKQFFISICMMITGLTPILRAEAPNQFYAAASEKLVFLIRWGVIKGGFATLEIEGPQFYEKAGTDCFFITSRARSNSFFDTFYKVRDINRSWVDAEGFFSYGFEKDHNEGKFTRYRDVFFDYGNEKIIVKSRTNVSERPIQSERLQDALSAMYFLRTQKIEMGGDFIFDVATEKKCWPLRVRVLRKEKIKVPAGRFNCIVVKPEMQDEGIFSAKGDLYIWLTDDERHMPVMMRSKIVLGSITVELISDSPGDFDRLFD